MRRVDRLRRYRHIGRSALPTVGQMRDVVYRLIHQIRHVLVEEAVEDVPTLSLTGCQTQVPQ